MVTNIEVIRQIVFSHARVMFISVGSDLKITGQHPVHFCQTEDSNTKHVPIWDIFSS